MPPSSTTADAFPDPLPTRPAAPRRRAAPDWALGLWVRGALLGISAGLVVVFVLATWINPYNEDGSARRMATHTQLGLQPCTAAQVLGIPCPACGMTTSFALLIRGDLVNSAQANCVGTLLGVLCLALIPWCLGSAVRNRALFVGSLERALIAVVVGLLVLMLLRWSVVVGLQLLAGWAPRL